MSLLKILSLIFLICIGLCVFLALLLESGLSHLFWLEHASEAERCDAPLNILLCGHALRSVAHGQSKRTANVPLTLTGKSNDLINVLIKAVVR